MNADSVTHFLSQADRYVDLWNTSDDAARRETIRSLWAENGTHVAPSVAVRGHEELEARVARSYQHWIVEKHCCFRKRSADGHHNIARIVWEMVDQGGNIESVGSEIIVLDDAGKIAGVYQFIAG